MANLYFLKKIYFDAVDIKNLFQHIEIQPTSIIKIFSVNLSKIYFNKYNNIGI